MTLNALKIIKDEEFPRNPSKAMHNGFVKAEEDFLKKADSKATLDKSGSCAIVVMIISNLNFGVDIRFLKHLLLHLLIYLFPR